MKLKKSFTFTDKNQIWRLLINDSDKLVIETRNTKEKEAFFHSYDLFKGKKVFKNLQLDDKFWVGIETIYKDNIIFHKYAKPNMPEHKKIIVLNINNQKIKWQNEEVTFLSVNDAKVYALKKRFEGQDLFVLNLENGNIIEELGNDSEKVNEIFNSTNFEKDFSDYSYPQSYSGNENYEVSLFIDQETSDKNNISNIEFMQFGDLLFFNYYVKTNANLLDNVFYVYDIEKKKKILSEVINKNLNSFSPDSYFCYKNNLLLIKNKNEIVSYKIL